MFLKGWEHTMAHISYSAFKTFNECPNKYKLNYIDGLAKNDGSEYTIFGTAIHEACELKVKNNELNEVKQFEDSFTKEITEFTSKNPTYNQQLLDEMMEQGRKLAPLVLPKLKEHFGEFEVIEAEKELLLPLPNYPEMNFKGYIDLVIKTADGKYHIIDYKTCSWGWDFQKKTDPIVNYQLTFYKHFFAEMEGIDKDLIETYFILLKRTAKKDNIEVYRVTSGPRKTTNAFTVLNTAVANIKKGNFPKIRTACKYCPFYKKECI